MNSLIDCINFPVTVFRGQDALTSLGAFCKTLGSKAFVLGGKTALEKTHNNIDKSLTQAGVQAVAVKWYGGECSQRNIDHLVAETKKNNAEVIIAVGGGKALDTGKLVAQECHLPVITVPTIAATCAAITPVSVLYTDQGEFVDMILIDHCPAATVIDTSVILQSPVRWLAAGMGDTLAKWYEYRVSILSVSQTSLTLAALSNGKLCYDLIEKFGGEARQSLENRTFSDALDSTVDAIILFAGLASIFGGEKIRSAAAHALHNGFTKIPAAHKMGHGFLVGYSNLCLLAMEGRPDSELLEAIEIAKRCAIPTKLSQIADLSEAELHTAAQGALLSPDMKNMPFTVTEEMIIDAIRKVDSLN